MSNTTHTNARVATMIGKLVEAYDTRTRDEHGKIVPGSGDPRACDCCGKEHVVHYWIQAGYKLVCVGRECAKRLTGNIPASKDIGPQTFSLMFGGVNGRFVRYGIATQEKMAALESEYRSACERQGKECKPFFWWTELELSSCRKEGFGVYCTN